jgi:hypothetical protein
MVRLRVRKIDDNYYFRKAATPEWRAGAAAMTASTGLCNYAGGERQMRLRGIERNYRL